MKEAITQMLGHILWGLIEGSSVVILDHESERVSKIQQPRIFIRLMSFLAFQKWATLYEREVGLQIAKRRREIFHWVLQCGGVRCKVAPCIGIERRSGQFALVTRLIKGRHPDQEETVSISREVTPLFLRAGVPTWSTCHFHPRFETNYIIDDEGTPWIVDGESHVPNIFVPSEELRNNLLIGNFPPLDDIHFPKLWNFYREESGSLPVEDREKFGVCIKECEELTREQKSRELRVWSRILGVLLRPLGSRKEWNQ